MRYCLSIMFLITVMFANISCNEGQYDNEPSVTKQKTGNQESYPIGIDTVAAWSNARFQIVVDALYDETVKPDPCILRRVRAFLAEDSNVYVLGKDAFVIIDLTQEAFVKHQIGSIPEQYQNVVSRLKNPANDSSIKIIPIINP